MEHVRLFKESCKIVGIITHGILSNGSDESAKKDKKVIDCINHALRTKAKIQKNLNNIKSIKGYENEYDLDYERDLNYMISKSIALIEFLKELSDNAIKFKNQLEDLEREIQTYVGLGAIPKDLFSEDNAIKKLLDHIEGMQNNSLELKENLNSEIKTHKEKPTSKRKWKKNLDEIQKLSVKAAEKLNILTDSMVEISDFCKLRDTSRNGLLAFNKITTNVTDLCEEITNIIPNVISKIDTLAKKVTSKNILKNKYKLQFICYAKELEEIIKLKKHQGGSDYVKKEIEDLYILNQALQKINTLEDNENILVGNDSYNNQISLDELRNIHNIDGKMIICLLPRYIQVMVKEHYSLGIKINRATKLLGQASEHISNASVLVDENLPAILSSLRNTIEHASGVLEPINNTIKKVNLAKIFFYFSFVSSNIFLVASSVVLSTSVHTIMAGFNGQTALLFGFILLSILFSTASISKVHNSHQDISVKKVFTACTFLMIAVSLVLIGFYVARVFGYAPINLAKNIPNEAIIALFTSLIVMLLMSGLLFYHEYSKYYYENREKNQENTLNINTSKNTDTKEKELTEGHHAIDTVIAVQSRTIAPGINPGLETEIIGNPLVAQGPLPETKLESISDPGIMTSFLTTEPNFLQN